jgi:predicted metal-dependent hydrolase
MNRQQETRDVSGIGTVILRRNSRARHVSIRVKPGGRVYVTVPLLVSYRRAIQFVSDKRDWILDKRALLCDSRPNLLGPFSSEQKEQIRQLAKNTLPGRVSMFAVMHGFQYNRVMITGAKTRWGSCSSRSGNINLSYYLVKLPEHLIEYVILHELAHTRVMQHNRKFYRLLDELTEGREKILRRELRTFSLL